MIAAVALIIAFVLPFMQQQMSGAQACYNARVDIKDACYYNGSLLKIRLGRGAEEFDLTGMMLQISTAEETKTKKLTESLNALEEKTFEINTEEFGLNSTDIISVGIAPIVKSGETEKTCDITATKTLAKCLYNCFDKNCGEDDESGKSCYGPCVQGSCKWNATSEKYECQSTGGSQS